MQMRGSGGGCALTTVDAQVLLQVVFVLKGFATLVAFELAIASRLRDVSLPDRESERERRRGAIMTFEPAFDSCHNIINRWGLKGVFISNVWKKQNKSSLDWSTQLFTSDITDRKQTNKQNDAIAC